MTRKGGGFSLSLFLSLSLSLWLALSHSFTCISLASVWKFALFAYVATSRFVCLPSKREMSWGLLICRLSASAAGNVQRKYLTFCAHSYGYINMSKVLFAFLSRPLWESVRFWARSSRKTVCRRSYRWMCN